MVMLQTFEAAHAHLKAGCLLFSGRMLRRPFSHGSFDLPVSCMHVSQAHFMCMHGLSQRAAELS